MSNFSLWFALSVFIVNVYIGLRVLLANRKQDCNKFFFCLTMATSFWMLFNFFALNVSDDTLSLLFVRLVMFVTTPIPNILYCLVLTFPHHRLRVPRAPKYAMLVLIVCVALLCLSPAVFTNALTESGTLKLTSGWGIILYGLNLFIFTPLAIWEFFKKIRVAKGLERVRLTYLTTAFVLAVILSSLFSFIFPVLLNNNDYTTLGSSFLALSLAVVIGYSLLKVRFSAIDFTIAKIVYWSVVTIWIALPFLYIRFFVSGFRSTNNYYFFLAILIGIVWLICLWQIYEKFERFLIKRIVNHGADWHTEKKLFLQEVSKEVDYQAILNQALDFYNRLIKNNGNLIIGDFFVDSKVSVIGDYKFYTSTSELYRQCGKLWPDTHQDFTSLIYEELNLLKDSRLTKITKIMARNNIGAIFAITFYDEFRGILVMSNKLSGNPYFAQDINMIEDTLAEIGPLLNKAVIYQTSRNFNTYLQKKIDRATVKLKKTNEKLIIADQLKDEFVSVASHELRTPMTAIKNYLWVIEKNLENGKHQDNRKYLQIAINSTERLIDMVNDMLTISRIEGNRYDLNKQTHDLRDLSRQVYHDLLPIAQNKKITLKLDLSLKAVLVSVDNAKVFEVLHNLVGNALKFTREGGVTIKCHTRGNRALFDVIDSGPGIAPEDADKLFQKFTRLEKSYVKIKETGTGLGLYISREIMHKHGGDISFVSTLGKGSTFTAHFPRAKSTPPISLTGK